MEVLSNRYLSGPLQELLTEFSVSEVYLDIKGVEEALKKDPTKLEFWIPAADSDKEIMFNNKELLCRFTSLSRDNQAKFLACVRKAMHENMVLEIQLVVGSRTIRIRQILKETGPIFGKGPLSITF